MIGCKKYRIYALCDDSAAVRYIGVTTCTIAKRLREHIKSSKSRYKHCQTYRDHWMRGLGYVPWTFLIEETDDIQRECFWIEFYKRAGCRLTNLTVGGDGVIGYTHTEKTRELIKRLHTGRKITEETRRKMSEAAKRRWEDPEIREKAVKSLTGHQVSESARKKISVARRALQATGWMNPMFGRKQTEESKQKNRDWQLRHNAVKRSALKKGVL